MREKGESRREKEDKEAERRRWFGQFRGERRGRAKEETRWNR